MDYKQIFDIIDRKEAEYIQVWKEVCDIESPTLYKEGVDAVGNYFIEKANQFGWKVDVLEEPVSGNAVCITMNPDAKKAPVALSAHMDTVHPLGLFGNPPTRIDMEADRIYGPGAMDCKAGLVAALMAMDALQEAGYTDRPVIFILQPDEENSSITSEKRTIQFMCDKAKGAAAFLNLEGGTAGTAVVARKGIIRFRLNITGLAAHSSMCADQKDHGVNAIVEAAHKILELEKMKDANGLTCNCGVISGGTVANTVPENCSFVADIRFANAEQMKEATDKVHAVAAHSYLEGTTCEVELVSHRIAMEAKEENYQLLDRINEISAETGLPVLAPVHRKGGSDAAYTTAAGIPSIDNLAPFGGRGHSVEEYGILSSLTVATKRLAAVILKL